MNLSARPRANTLLRREGYSRELRFSHSGRAAVKTNPEGEPVSEARPLSRALAAKGCPPLTVGLLTRRRKEHLLVNMKGTSIDMARSLEKISAGITLLVIHHARRRGHHLHHQLGDLFHRARRSARLRIAKFRSDAAKTRARQSIWSISVAGWLLVVTRMQIGQSPAPPARSRVAEGSGHVWSDQESYPGWSLPNITPDKENGSRQTGSDGHLWARGYSVKGIGHDGAGLLFTRMLIKSYREDVG